MAHADGGLRMAELGLGGQAQVPGRNLRVLAIQPWVFNLLKWEPAYCEARGAAPLRYTPQVLWSPRLHLVMYASSFLVSPAPASACLHAPCSLPVPVTLLTRAVPLQMSNITVTYRDGRVAQLEQVYIRGSKIRFLILPDMLKNAPMLKSMKNKNQGSGAGRGKAAILKAQGRCCGHGAAPGPAREALWLGSQLHTAAPQSWGPPDPTFSVLPHSPPLRTRTRSTAAP